MKSSASTSSTPDCRTGGPPAEDGTTASGALDLQIKQRALALGFNLVGITSAQPPNHAREFQRWLAADFHGEMGYLAKNAQRRTEPSQVLPDVQSIVVVGMNHYTGDHDRLGRIARYAWGSCDYHDVMAEKLKQLSAAINELGGPNTRSLWYVDTGPVLERDLAQRAGVGFIGKHTNLISRRLGNWIFLGEVLTTLGLPPDQPEREYCGTCHRCVDACPTRAIVGPYRLDARLCISYLTIELKGAIPLELRPLIGDHVF